MRTKIFTLLMLATLSTQAQLVISENNFPFVSQVSYTNLIIGTLAIPQPGANMTWDYSDLHPRADVYNTFYIPYSGTAVPGATEKANTIQYFGPLPIETDYYYKKDNTGYYELGQGYRAQAIPAAVATGDPNDTIYVPEYISLNEGTTQYANFPMTMGTEWTSEYKTTVNSNWSIDVFGFDKTPVSIITHYKRKNTVVGWGQCILPGKNGASVSSSVLMLRVVIARTDSIFTDGTYNPFLASTLGFIADTTWSAYDDFYRDNGGIQSLFTVYYADTARDSIAAAVYSTEFETAGLQDIQRGNFSVYPNPVNGTTVNLAFASEHTAAAFALYSVTGQKVATLAAEQTGSNYQLAIPAQLPAGVYFIKATNASGTLNAVEKITITR